MLLYIQRNCRLIRDRSPGCPPWLSHSSWALLFRSFYTVFKYEFIVSLKGSLSTDENIQTPLQLNVILLWLDNNITGVIFVLFFPFLPGMRYTWFTRSAPALWFHCHDLVMASFLQPSSASAAVSSLCTTTSVKRSRASLQLQSPSSLNLSKHQLCNIGWWRWTAWKPLPPEQLITTKPNKSLSSLSSLQVF